MTELYALAFKLCISALISNPFTVQNLPPHQQMYIVKSVLEECRKQTEADRLMMCVEQNFQHEDC